MRLLRKLQAAHTWQRSGELGRAMSRAGALKASSMRAGGGCGALPCRWLYNSRAALPCTTHRLHLRHQPLLALCSGALGHLQVHPAAGTSGTGIGCGSRQPCSSFLSLLRYTLEAAAALQASRQHKTAQVPGASARVAYRSPAPMLTCLGTGGPARGRPSGQTRPPG